VAINLKAFIASKFDGDGYIWLLIDDQHCAFATVVGIEKLMWATCCWLDQMQPVNNLELRWGLESFNKNDFQPSVVFIIDGDFVPFLFLYENWPGDLCLGEVMVRG
jgi:hypothetical protein